MANRKLTPEEKIIAIKKRNERNCNNINKRRQDRLEKAFIEGIANIKRCQCGKYFDANLYCGLENMQGSQRIRCVKCPLQPELRERKVYSKRKQEWVIRLCKRG